MRLLRSCLFLLAACAPLAGHAQAVPAGTLTLLNGQAQDTDSAGMVRSLAKGDAVYPGDTLQTADGSYALVRFTDQGSVLLRPQSRFQVAKYQYAAAPAAPAAAAPAQREAPAPLQASASAPDSSFFRLLKGGLRAVSGLIAHADYSHYRMDTPVATMGIRGTDYEIALCDAGCASDKAITSVVPAGEDLNGAVVSGVNEGQIEVIALKTGGSLTLGPGQYCITLTDGSQYLLNAIPALLANGGGTAVATGTAAGGAAAASSAAAGSLLAAGITGVAAAALIGVVVSSSSSNSTTATTSTAPAGASTAAGR
jgi:hypothetical protein